MEHSDPADVAELESWLRTDPAAVDGVPVDAVPAGDPRARPSNWLIRDFVVGQREPQRTFGGPRTPTRRRRTWSGRPWSFWAPRGTLDWPATRTRMQSRLSLVGHPQMLLRMGYPPETAAHAVSGRRPVGDVLQFLPARG
jgi:hypothetical protein